MNSQTCHRCGGSRLEPGTMQVDGLPFYRFFFRLQNAKFWTFRTSYISVQAAICLGCGAIELTGDAEKAEQLTNKASSV